MTANTLYGQHNHQKRDNCCNIGIRVKCFQYLEPIHLISVTE